MKVLCPSQKRILEVSLAKSFAKIDLTMDYVKAMEIIEICHVLELDNDLIKDMKHSYEHGRIN